jgi:hypothetical protein
LKFGKARISTVGPKITRRLLNDIFINKLEKTGNSASSSHLNYRPVPKKKDKINKFESFLTKT